MQLTFPYIKRVSLKRRIEALKRIPRQDPEHDKRLIIILRLARAKGVVKRREQGGSVSEIPKRVIH